MLYGLLYILKDDAVKVLHSICQQTWKTQTRQQDWQRSLFISTLRKQCHRVFKLQHNYTHLTCQQNNSQNSPSQASTVHEPSTSGCSSWIQKTQKNQDQIANIGWVIEKARQFQKNIYFCFTDGAKAFDCVDHSKLSKIPKEIGIPDHLSCLLRNLHAGQETAVRTRLGTTDWFQIGKGVHQGCILSPCLFNLYTEYIMRNAGLDEAQLESTLLGEVSITSDVQMIPPLWQKVKRN